MERFSNRGNVLLGYHNPSSSMEPSSSSRNSDELDVDFNDVFGGPPRRSSIHDIRHSFGGCGGGGMMDSGDAGSRSPWAAGMSNEKPVFGEEIGDRRRQASDDFYDDIFRGSEGSYSSPRKSSTPCSRVLSPARSLPPKAEPFGTSLPAQFSLPAKLTKSVDLPTFGSSPRSANKHKDGSSTPNTSLSRFSSQSFQDQNVQSLLSPELPFSNEEVSYITKSNENEVGGNLKGGAKRLEVLVRKGQFHFSIYKWPNVGIPLLSPLGDGKRLTFKENGKFERCLSSKGRIESEYKTRDLSAIINDSAESFQIVEEGLKNSKPQPLETIQRGEIKPVSLPEIGLSDGNKKDFSSVSQEINKPNLKPLQTLLSDDIEEQGDENTLKNADGKENMEKATTVPRANVDVTSSVKKHEEKKRNNKKAEVIKDPVSSPNSGDSRGKSRVKGKVKDFVKIFNQETPSTTIVNVVGRSQGSKGKGTDKDGADSEVAANAAMENKKAVPIVNMKPNASLMVEEKSGKSKRRNSGQKTKKPDMNTKPDSSFTVEETVEKSNKHQSRKIPTRPDASFMAEEKREKLMKQQSGEKSTKPDASFTVEEGTEKSNKKRPELKTTIHKSNDDNRPAQMKASQRPESFARRSNVTIVDIDDMFDDNFQIQELAPEDGKPSENTDDSHVDLDSQIRQWSNGKIGNIRSLLSTLQLVLWPESGWKPVPLMDVIEGNQVKRAYQRALLCLHPDKLQQKGAAAHQKYIAEKVFDILQEAWDQFNSIGL